MSYSVEIYADDLVTLIGTITSATSLSWSHELEDYGGGAFTIDVADSVVQANPTILDGDNLVKIVVDGVARFAFLIRKRKRTGVDASGGPIEVAGPDAIALLARALVYPPHGLDELLVDERLFAWQSIDYSVGAGWGTPTSLGTYGNPTDPQLLGTEPLVDEVQTVELNAEAPPYPWGADYPSPGGLPGTWQLEHRGKVTAAIQWDANAAAIEAALEALPHIDGVTVALTAGGSGEVESFTVTFDGASVAGQAQELLKLHHSQLRHGSSGVTRTTAGTEDVEATQLVPGWPDPSSQWLGNFGELAHYRRVVDVEAADKSGRARLFAVTAGSVLDVWFDGDHLGSAGKLDLKQWDVNLYDLDHALAFRADGPMMWVVVRLRDDGELGGILYRGVNYSGDPYDLVVYGPDEPPGVTPGFMLRTLVDEADARGFLPPVTVDFDETTDSLGRAWTIDLELGLQVGNDSVLSAAERLRDLGVYVELTPGLVFRAWEGTRTDRGGTPAGGASTVTFTHATGDDSVTGLKFETEDEKITALLMRLVDTWVERHVAGPRREAFLSLGTVPSVRAALEIADRILDDLAVERESLKWSTSSAQAGAPQPYADAVVGDVVQAPYLPSITNLAWTLGDVLVLKLTADVDEAGTIVWSWEGEPV